ncbi:hypothetical protein BCPG3_094 [Bacillus phage BCPG3]|uniref:Uncharacterized protein n=2 Tax=Wphvirus TaxID=1922327 RepID=W5QUI6_9CAUD|nr:hypothetical protein BPS13_0092 [Bacillus phage BPS13]YP_009002977.1 hypothetical protein BPS10C_091 [Bacillus phage BPS10C]QQO38902.1 hypothetical protein BCPG1_171 [Bacillus phage BCPG1]QSJ04411.1 hypothetical protein BCPG3_094 [Bacillus phage BCPG3]QSJ04622.1 hypothetical protein BCP18_090 [Bacillus phage BCP18]AEZ50271.1 hypothetical protein BPS13_0092 [Bacillus phage BPS13]AGI12088.1 hypothetical protein BPS10C_091 [Bacillus phage BPS10C]
MKYIKVDYSVYLQAIVDKGQLEREYDFYAGIGSLKDCMRVQILVDEAEKVISEYKTQEAIEAHGLDLNVIKYLLRFTNFNVIKEGRGYIVIAPAVQPDTRFEITIQKQSLTRSLEVICTINGQGEVFHELTRWTAPQNALNVIFNAFIRQSELIHKSDVYNHNMKVKQSVKQLEKDLLI